MMTDRCRQALQRSAADNHRHVHQILFYALCRDLLDLTTNRSSSKHMVSAKEILDLQAEYCTAEHEVMTTLDTAALRGHTQG
jgi:hypothetical protein